MSGLTPEELYNFDTAGWLHLRGVLDAEGLARIAARCPTGDHADLSELAWELAHDPPLKQRLAQLVVTPNRASVDAALSSAGELTLKMNGHAVMLGGDGGMTRQQDEEEDLVGGPGAHGVLDMTRSYSNEADHRYIHGLVVIWALGGSPEAAGGYAVVSASHKATLPIPAHWRLPPTHGGHDAALRDLGLLHQPDIRAGDVLLVSSATLQGVRRPLGALAAGPRLLRCELLSRRARLTTPQSAHHPSLEEDWMAELTPLQRTVMGLEPQHRTPLDGHPTVRAKDGRAWLEPESTGGGAVYHPSVLKPNLDCSDQQHEESSLWEIGGYLILRNAMDPGSLLLHDGHGPCSCQARGDLTQDLTRRSGIILCARMVGTSAGGSGMGKAAAKWFGAQHSATAGASPAALPAFQTDDCMSKGASNSVICRVMW
jgi:hypothetical protein